MTAAGKASKTLPYSFCSFKFKI